MEEGLREAAALGDLEEVQKLLRCGANVNSQNEINGWTCLHWACKRNHLHIVSFLLEAGADTDILTSKGERPVQLTSKKDIKRLLGVEEPETEERKLDSELPFVPNYLANPPFPYSFSRENTDKEEPTGDPHSENGPSCNPPHLAMTYPSLSNGMENVCISTSSTNEDPLPALFFNRDVHVAPDCALSSVQSGPVCSPVVPPNLSLFSPVSNSHHHGSVNAGPMQVFQPFFFTELVLKVRIQSAAPGDTDFIEVEMDRQELTYRELLRVCCIELKVSPENVEKIRKLPNTMLRKDKDVARLQDFQELELVLRNSSDRFRTSTSLTDRPCFNKNASQLTY
ncbi:ankyrin repeat domain-containing protein 40 isoform X2 [Xenopus laevis]|uniref:Ankyrin repeat domain-containing protein 40 isoform X2 n=1 Tax=Xenopus laevis TaxID=8355 RepID=A0A8J0TSK0_XENLA|nr:ankyrin repeat domain-containing protein 40 isoform X2 [Xenopus laevis]